MSTNDDIELITKQEGTLHFASFGEDDAWKLGSQMRAAAISQKLPLVIDIRCAGRRLFYTALPGTTPGNEGWVQRKINVVHLTHKSSYRISRELAISGAALDHSQGLQAIDYAPHGGCFPIHIEAVGVVGTITVSGIPQREDHGFVVQQICVFLGKDALALGLKPETK